MKPNAINSLELLDLSRAAQNCDAVPDESKDIENCPSFPDANLSSGILLSLVLLGIYGLAGGVVVLLIAACVLIVGLGLGIIWKRHFPYRIGSITKPVPAVNRSYQWTNVKTHWLKQNDGRIFFDTALGGCYL